MQGLDRADRAALGLLLLIWEPLFILSIVAASASLIWMISWGRRYGTRAMFTWVLFGLTIACFLGVFVGADHLTQALGASNPAQATR